MEFNDLSFTSSANIWSAKIFGTTEGQLNHYFDEISEGVFQFTPAPETDGLSNGIVTTKLNINHPGNQNAGFLPHLKTALSQIDAKIDFKSFDLDGNMAISRDELQIMFLIAGRETATGFPPQKSIWAHASCFSESILKSPNHDKVSLMNCADNGRYSRFRERRATQSGSHDATIGVIAHELGHAAFDLPDLYDIDSSSAGIGAFGVMGSGSWGHKQGDNYPGQTPVHPLGFIKGVLGWKTFKTITQSSTYNEDTQTIAAISIGEKEAFLIENRDNSGYDRGLYFLQKMGDFRGGSLITHFDGTANASNANDAKRWIDVEEANNAGLDYPRGATGSHTGHYKNLFFQGNANSFTGSTSPNSNRNDGTKSGVSLNNISPSTSMAFELNIQP